MKKKSANNWLLLMGLGYMKELVDISPVQLT